MLRVEGIETGYGASRVLFGLDLEIPDGGMVALLGRNGMGKTTTVRAIMGLNRVNRGRILLEDTPIHNRAPWRIARMGVGLVPEGRQIFPSLTVRENLLVAAADRSGAFRRWTLTDIYRLFPILEERSHLNGNRLSGGEQQMLAIGRALMTDPGLLILDEATEGLAPAARSVIWKCLMDLKGCGLSFLVIDKNVDALARICDQCVIIEKGRAVWQGGPRELMAAPDVRHAHLGV